jgi:hypothetical protein
LFAFGTRPGPRADRLLLCGGLRSRYPLLICRLEPLVREPVVLRRLGRGRVDLGMAIARRNRQPGRCERALDLLQHVSHFRRRNAPFDKDFAEQSPDTRQHIAGGAESREGPRGSFLLSVNGAPIAWADPHGASVDWIGAPPGQIHVLRCSALNDCYKVSGGRSKAASQ